MAVKRVEAKEAAELLDNGWTYLDVRSVPEFNEGHPPGAYNIPLMNKNPGGGMAPNPDFLAVVEGAFEKDARLVVACRAGGRSARAVEMMTGAGFTDLIDLRGGFVAEVVNGAVTCQGWSHYDLPVETDAQAGRDYESLKAKAS